MNFNTQQNLAIKDRSPYLLVSAAAGAGKTAVLVERILSMIIDDHISIDRMLIMTFTRAAASELKMRLSKRIYEASKQNPDLIDEHAKLAFANIGTMHSFCLKIIRQEFALIKIDPNVKIASDTFKFKLYEQAIDEMFEEVYTDPTPEVQSLVENYKESEILEIIDALYSKVLSMPHPWEWLDEACNSNNSDKLVINLAGESLYQDINRLKPLIDNYKNYPHEEQVKKDMETLDIFDFDKNPFDYENIKKYQVQLSGKIRFKADNIYGLTKEEDQKWAVERNKINKQLKEKISTFIDKIMDFPKKKELIYAHISAIAQMLKVFHKHFQAIKRKKNVLDHSDMEHFALEILESPYIDDKIKNSFDAIFVDECQDNSSIQDSIIHSLKSKTNNIFMVGDIKQGIYRFRNAEPSLFLEKIHTYQENEGNEKRKILLNKNYRSNPLIIDSVNRVFNTVFNPKIMELDYKQSQDWLNAGREDNSASKVKLRNIYYDSSKAKDGNVVLANYLARQISNLVGTKAPYGDGNIKYSDIAILAPKVTETGLGRTIIDTLDQNHIPFVCVKLDAISGYTGVDQVIAWLSILCNSYDDISLLTILRGPVFSLDDDTLAKIRIECPEKDLSFSEAFYYCASLSQDREQDNNTGSIVDWSSTLELNRIHTFSSVAENKKHLDTDNSALYKLCNDILKIINQERLIMNYTPLDKYIWSFYERSELYDYYERQVNPEEYRQQIEAFCVSAKQYVDDTELSVANFVADYKLAQKKSPKKDMLNFSTNTQNHVTVGTIHSSKGLEYPIVFLIGMESGIGSSAQDSKLAVVNNKYGIGLKYRDRKNFIKESNMLFDAINFQNNSEQKAERARLLYVAMTRAREALYIVNTQKISISDENSKDINEEIKNDILENARKLSSYSNELALIDANSYMDLILSAISGDNDYMYANDKISNLDDSNNTFIDKELDFIDIKDVPKSQDFYEWDIKNAFASDDFIEKNKDNIIDSSVIDEEKFRQINEEIKKIDVSDVELSNFSPKPDHSILENVGERVLLKTTVTYVSDYITKLGKFNVKLPISDNIMEIPEPQKLLYQYNKNQNLKITPDLEHKEKEPDARRIGSISHKVLELLDLNTIRKLLMGSGKEYRMGLGYNNIADIMPTDDKTHTPLLDDDTIAKFKQELSNKNIISYELKSIYDMIEAILQDLKMSNSINSLEYAKVDRYDIASFFISNLGIRMLNSNLVLREHPITLFFPKWEPQVVQGIIDICFLEDGKWVIVDYKSDSQNHSEKSENYLQQIALYKLALDSASPFKTKECFIYSIKHRKETRV